MEWFNLWSGISAIKVCVRTFFTISSISSCLSGQVIHLCRCLFHPDLDQQLLAESRQPSEDNREIPEVKAEEGDKDRGGEDEEDPEETLVKIGAEADILVGGVDDGIKDKSVSVPVQVVNPDTPLHTYIYLMLLNFGKSVVYIVRLITSLVILQRNFYVMLVKLPPFERKVPKTIENDNNF